LYIYIFFFYLRGCPSQLARTTTNSTTHWTPCKLNEHIRHRKNDRHTHKNSNPEATREDKPLVSQANTLSASYCIYLVTSNKFKWYTVHLLKSFFFLPPQLGPRVTDTKLFQAIVDQCTENTKKKKSNRDFASTPLLFFLEPFLFVLLL